VNHFESKVQPVFDSEFFIRIVPEKKLSDYEEKFSTAR